MMLVMEERIALNPSALTVRMETVVMMPLACARLDGRVTLALRKHVTVIVPPTVASVIMVTVCVPLGSLEFNVRPRWTFAPMTAVAMVSVMNGASNATALKAGPPMIAVLRLACKDAANQMASVSMVRATAPQVTVVLLVGRKSVPTIATTMESATVRSASATAIQDGLVTTAV